MDLSKNRVNPSNAPESGESATGGGRRYGGVDKDERQRQRRQRLVEAGLAVFGEVGFHGATVRLVCKRAELTSRYFYESFDSMEALFEAVYVSVSTELMRRTMASLAVTPLKPDLLAEASLRTFLEYIREDTHRARVALIEALTVGAGMHRISQGSNKDFARLIASFIGMLYPTLEEETRLNPIYIANGLVGSNIRIATLWVEDKCSLPLDDVLRNMFAFYQAAITYADVQLKAAREERARAQGKAPKA